MKDLKELMAVVRKESPILFWIVLAHFVMAGLCIPGLIFDDRILLGINVWVKPFKFAISTGIYILTIGYLINFYPFSKRKKRIINGLVSWTLLVEVIIIFVQGARGVQSHYNDSTPIDAIMYLTMGIFVSLNVLVMVLFLVETVRLKLKTSKSIQWAIFMGWVVVLVGSWVGGQMISQLAHNVGIADGGAGLPLVNWSTIAGDLRIAHFFGLHGIQVIPLFAFLISKKWKLENRNQTIIVSVFAFLYTSWIAFTFYQASQGIALIEL